VSQTAWRKAQHVHSIRAFEAMSWRYTVGLVVPVGDEPSGPREHRPLRDASDSLRRAQASHSPARWMGISAESSFP